MLEGLLNKYKLGAYGNFFGLISRKYPSRHSKLSFDSNIIKINVSHNRFFSHNACTLNTFIQRLPECFTAKNLDKQIPTTTKTLPSRSYKRYFRIFWQLSKGKLTTWVVLSTLPGFFMSLNSPLIISTLISLCVGTFLTSAAANIQNQIIERDKDAIMFRTRTRPIPRGRIDVQKSQIISVICSIFGLTILSFGTNSITAFLAASNIIIYSFLYTPLKVVTPYNTHVGSITGSIPVLMGCAATGESLLTYGPWILYTTQTLWQMSHFYSLAWLHKSDYKFAGYKMFPLLNDTNPDYVISLIRPYLYSLTLLPLICSVTGITSYMFLVDSLIPNVFILKKFRDFCSNPTEKNMRNFFVHSLWQLLLLLTLISYHSSKSKSSGICTKNFDHIDDRSVLPHDKNCSSNHIDDYDVICGIYDGLKINLIKLCPHQIFVKPFQTICPVDLLTNLFVRSTIFDEKQKSRKG